MGKLLEYTGEAVGYAATFILAFFISTGLTCNGKRISCDQAPQAVKAPAR